ncbi:MAG: rRNA maturation RNase YbeY [Micrococcales bacterium]
MSIELSNETDFELDEVRVRALAEFAMDKMRLHPATDLYIRFVDEATMTDLHVKHMDEPGPTDVLSFPMDELIPGTDLELTPAGILGDIVICPEFAARQAETAGHAPIDEFLLLTAHGVLHLLGFDHAEPEEEKQMFGLQRQILDDFYASESAA